MIKQIKALQQIKTDKKISLYSLAIDVGVSYTVIRKFLKGQTNITCDNFTKIYNYIDKNGLNENKKIKNEYLTKEILKKKTSKKYGKQKWIIFAEELLNKGYKISLYEARRTFSKYLTVEKDGKQFKVRFSNHKPIKEREENNDCDFFVGVTNFKVTTTEDALQAVYTFFKRKEQKKMTTELQNVNLDELTKRMDELKDYKAKLDLELKQTKKEIEKIELELANVLEKAEVQSMNFGVYSFGWVKKTRTTFSQKAFGQVYPDLLEKFKIETTTKKLEFKINK